MSDREIEIKLKVKNVDLLSAWLKKYAKQIHVSAQIDMYFDPPNRSFLYVDKRGKKTAEEYIRVRFDKNDGAFCYKYINKEQELQKNVEIKEIETKVENPENVLKILKTLGFKNTITIKKHRKSYSYKEFQIDVDNVEILGDFVEIEYKGEEQSSEESFQKIQLFLRDIGINDWEQARGGYVEMMLNKK